MAGSIISASSNTQTYQLLLTNFQTALSNPLFERCSQLYQLLQDPPLKEIQYVFPGLVENIFGVHTGIDWGLLTLDKDLQHKEFESLKKLLSSEGPVLKIIYKFTEEFSPKFEFPFACLPMPTQIMLKEGKVPALYTNKLHVSSPGMFPSALQLNAFEFYFFHFCYFIVNPMIKNSNSVINQHDTLYAHLLEDYLAYFLPTENRAVPLYQPQNIQHSPVLSSSFSSNYGSPHSSPDNRQPFSILNNKQSRPDFLSPVQQKPSLLKKGTVLMVTSPSSNSPSGFGTSPTESWKSETLVLILKEMYLNQNSADQQQTNALALIPKTFIPSHYHVWMVRIMVKHLHFFFNSTLSSNQSTSHGQIMIDSLGRLKSLGMTQLIQKEMYVFLKTVFGHWPLDASFRVPLETYLSYIQPWRYTQCDLEPSIWQKFLNENILFYTTILVQILKRFLRMDLSCPKTAYMLYRLSKVISIGELREMIMQAEKGCVSKPSNVGMPGFFRSSEKLSYQKISQLEMTGSSYVPLFSEPVFIMVTHLLSSIAAAREKSSTELLSQNNSSKSFFEKVCSFFELSDDAGHSDDNSPADMQKVSSYLEQSSKHLCNFFREVAPPTLNTSSSLNPLTSPSSHTNSSTDFNATKFLNLSTLDRSQMLSKRKNPAIAYHGNPDLQPIRTYEVGFLVKILNEISQQLNEKYESNIDQLYNRDSLIGKMCRRVLAPPMTYYNIIKSKDMLSVSSYPVHLPPRINMRILAHKQLILYFALFMFFIYLWGSNPIISLLFLLLLLILLLFISALIYPIPVHHKND